MTFNNIKYSLAIRHQEIIKNCELKKKKVSYSVVENAYILPHLENNTMLYGKGGVVNEENCFEMQSVFSLIMNSKPTIDWGGSYNFNKQECKQCSSTVIFGGFINNNEWGHFIVDWSTRLWYAIKNDTVSKIAFCSRQEIQHIMPNILRIIELAGIDINRILIITPNSKPLHAKYVIIPEEAIGRNYYSDEYFLLFDKAIETVKKMPLYYEKHDKIYLTRTQLNPVKEIGEKKIEKLFSQKGFYVISPEKLSVEEQIYYMISCKVLASIEGSAAHNIVFGRNSMQRQLILEKSKFYNIRQIILNQICQIQTDYVGTYPKKDPLSFNVENVFCILITKQLVRYLQLKNDDLIRWSGNVLTYVLYVRTWLTRKVKRCIKK